MKKYTAALMSNHKWRKLYRVMAEHGSELCGIEYRFTDTDRVLIGTAPVVSQIWDSAIDNPVQGAGGPIEYKHIESISIPYVFKFRPYKNAPVSERAQEIEPFLEALAKVGEFPVYRISEYVEIRGYNET